MSSLSTPSTRSVPPTRALLIALLHLTCTMNSLLNPNCHTTTPATNCHRPFHIYAYGAEIPRKPGDFLLCLAFGGSKRNGLATKGEGNLEGSEVAISCGCSICTPISVESLQSVIDNCCHYYRNHPVDQVLSILSRDQWAGKTLTDTICAAEWR